MKILLSAYACEPYKGSEEGSGWNWAYNLTKSGHDVWVITTPYGKEAIERFLNSKNIKNLNFIYVDLNILGINFDKILNFKFSYYIKYLIWQYKIVRIAKKIDTKANIDIIHHVSWGSLQLGSLLWKLNKPFVFGTVGGGQLSNRIFKNEFGSNWRIEKIREHITNSKLLRIIGTGRAAEKADITLVTNNETLNLAKKYGASNIELMLDTSIEESYISDYAYIESSEKIRVLWVGRLQKRKGLSLFLKIINKVKSKNIEFIIIGGNGESRDEILNFMEEKRDSRVKWLDQISWNEVREYYKIATIFVFTSIRDSFGSQVLEAMAHGLPIIALNQFGLRDFIPDDASIKINVENSVENIIIKFAEAIDFLSNNINQRRKMSKSAYKFAKSNTWNYKVERINKYYNYILSSNTDRII